MTSGGNFLEALSSITEDLLTRELGNARQVALLDFPSHMNVGDSMIWAGEVASLGRIGVRVRYIADATRYDPGVLRRVHPEGPILLHGGGNFGDLWPSFQDFRERVLTDFPDRKVIQLPQSIHYADRGRASSADHAMGNHPDFLLLCRDHASLTLAADLLPSVRRAWAPDAAYGWRPPTSGGTRSGTLVLLRRDHEAQLSTKTVEEWCRRNLASTSTVFADWGLTGVDAARWRLARVPGAIARRVPQVHRLPATTAALSRGYASMLHLNLDAGLRLFRNKRLIVTDRLHAHVLATMLDIPHVVLDNSYGKIASVGAAGSLDQPCANYAATPEDAITLIEQNRVPVV